MIVAGNNAFPHLLLVVGIAPLVAAGLIAGAGALIKGVGGYLGNRSKQKQQAEAARLAHEAAQRKWDQQEQSRIAILTALKNRGGPHGPKVQALLQGIGGPGSPEMMARPYAGPEIGQETGQSTLGSVLSGVGAVASAYGDYKLQKLGADQRASQQEDFLCAAYPNLPICASLGGAVPPQGGFIGGTPGMPQDNG
jgi:hypothetical protein